MEKEKMERINFLAKKKKEVGLTKEELEEQQVLYKEYIEAFRRSLRGTLDNTVIARPDGSTEAVKDRYKK